ncbi:unnamed protein product [Rhizopus stolonifer]
MLLSTDNSKLSRIHSFVEEQKMFAPHYLPPDEIPVSIIISDDAPSSGGSLVLTSISQTSEKKKAKMANRLPTTKSNGLHLLESFSSPNLEINRITMNSCKQPSLGLFNKGKSSSKGKLGRGVSDLVFSESKFLKRRHEEKKDDPPKQKHKGKRHKKSSSSSQHKEKKSLTWKKKNLMKEQKNFMEESHSKEKKQKSFMKESHSKEQDDTSAFESIERILAECRRAPQPKSISQSRTSHQISVYSSPSQSSCCASHATTDWQPPVHNPLDEFENFWKAGIKRNL